MEPNDLLNASLSQLSKQLEDGILSSTQLCQAFLDQVATYDDTVNAFLHLDAEKVLQAAAASDARRAGGSARSAFDGIPVALKDILAIEGEPLTAASRILEHFISPYTGTVGQKLEAAGMIPFGRLNMDEFAMGSSTENSAYKATTNPWNPAYAPGGSSGGSAAAVAARMAPVTLGSDTGGSIRQPAAFCGIVGLKPTYGRVSRYGLAAFASSLDQIGPMGRSVDDVAALLDIIDGHDPLDSTSWPEPLEAVTPQLAKAGLPRRIGLPREYLGDGIAPSVREQVEAAIELCRKEGTEVVEISLPHTHLAVPTYYVVATAEASSNLARYDGVRYTSRSAEASDAVNLYATSRGEGFGPEVKRRIILGSYVLSSGYYDAWYTHAQKVRTLIRDDFLKAFSEVDLLLTPTSPTPAFKLGEKLSDPLNMYLADIFTISVNLAGLPALSLPSGLSPEGLPVGIQLIGQPFQEGPLLKAAKLMESRLSFNSLPPLLTH
jgi:aspartyl-tRNA(Asn)/glutamyl-tRNA(Gln) amidotransferase subunit A